MKTRRKEELSTSSSISSTGDGLPKRKTSSTAKVSIKEFQDEQCEGIHNLRKLQNYVNAAENGSESSPDKVLYKEKVPKKCAEPESNRSQMEMTESKTTLKRKPKSPAMNPLWTDTKSPDHPLLPIPCAPRSVEIRGGDILGQCECVKRNGLQHDCPKWDCRGEDLCLTWPMPTCQPSGLGVPIVVESRVKRPDSAHCELTDDEKKKAEKTAAMEKRKEEVRLVEHARSNWKTGKDQLAVRKAANQKSGYLKCNIHSGKYRLVPLMRDEITQTSNELPMCPCDELEDKHLNKDAGDAQTKPLELPVNQKEHSLVGTQGAKKDITRTESVQTSTTGIPTVKTLKSFIKTCRQ